MPLNINLQQILLHLFNFAILFGGLYLLLYKPVKDFMDKREAKYKAMADEAALKNSQADQLKAQYQAKLDQADQEIAQRKKTAQQEMQDKLSQEEADAHQKAEQILAKARREAEADKASIMDDASKQIRSLAEEAASKLAQKSVSDVYDEFLTTADTAADGSDSSAAKGGDPA